MLGFRVLEYDPYGYLVTWKGRNWRILEDKEMSFQDFKLYFWRTSYSWIHVLNGGTNLTILDFVDNIMHRA